MRSVGAKLHNVTVLLDVSMRDAVQTQLDKRRTVATHNPTKHKEIALNKDQLKGRAKQAKGKAQEIAGKVLGNKTQETKGKVEKTVGKVQKDLGDLASEVEKNTRPR